MKPLQLWKQAKGDTMEYTRLMVEHGYAVWCKPGDNVHPGSGLAVVDGRSICGFCRHDFGPAAASVGKETKP